MFVATVLTVYGIETLVQSMLVKNKHWVATVLTVYGIETTIFNPQSIGGTVATVLTVYGIETQMCHEQHIQRILVRCNSTYRLRY